MSNTIKGLLIDPENQEIREVDVQIDKEGSTLHSMYQLLECSAVDVGRNGLKYLPSKPDDDIWFDDEALLSDKKHCFTIPHWVPLIGKGLILGYNDDGDCVSHHLTAADIEALKNSILWSINLML